MYCLCVWLGVDVKIIFGQQPGDAGKDNGDAEIRSVLRTRMVLLNFTVHAGKQPFTGPAITGSRRTRIVLAA
jgi:hypothetical protein